MTRVGLVVGKFIPPHLGHHDLIDSALQHCTTCYVVVCDNPVQRPSALQRASWLAQRHPLAEVVVVPDLCAHHGLSPCPPACSPAWAAHLRTLLPCAVDVVVSSETYGPLLATALGAEHVAYDPARTVRPVSGTAIRADAVAAWADVAPLVRAGLTRRLVVLGAESSGTTTLTRDLAAARGLHTTVEAGRTLSWALAARDGGIEAVTWTEADFWWVLHAQRAQEAAVIHGVAHQPTGTLGGWIVCDTDALATVAWWERYLATPSITALAFAMSSLPAAYIVTDPKGVAFAQDGLRDGEALRDSMHQRFIELTAATGVPTLVASGHRDARVAAAAAFLDGVVASHPTFVAA